MNEELIENYLRRCRISVRVERGDYDMPDEIEVKITSPTGKVLMSDKKRILTMRQIEAKWHSHTLAKIMYESCGIVQIEIGNKEEDRSNAHIWDLWVVPESRQRGLATRLLREAESYARSKGCTTASLEWNEIDSSRFVKEWYIRNGYDVKEFGIRSAKLVKKL